MRASPVTERLLPTERLSPPRRQERQGSPGVIALALVLATCGAARAAETSSGDEPGEPAKPAEPKPRFIVEYLPPLVYRDRESIYVRFRVENPGKAEVECTVSATLDVGGEDAASKDGEDAPESPAPVILRVPAEGKRSGGFTLPSDGWARSRIELSCDGTRSTVLVIRRFGEDGVMPPLEARGERLYVRSSPRASAGSEAAVVVLRQRVSVDDREWVMMKFLAEQLSEGTTPAGVTLLGPAFRGPQTEGATTLPAYMRAVREGAGTRVEATALPGEAARGVTHPILADFAVALEALEGARPAELVIWVVACDDARRATPARTFRKAVDFLIFRARRRSASLTVLSVPEPAVLAARQAVYTEELRKSASAFRSVYARVDALDDVECWRPEGAPRSQNALARYPNSKGHAALAEAILEQIRP